MSGLEQAIRNALERAERSHPEIRSRIYQSARNALDAGLRKQEIDDPEVIERQRQRLEITIRAIEEEELERLRMAARLEKVIIENSPFPEETVDADEQAEVAAPDIAVAPPQPEPIEPAVAPEIPPAVVRPASMLPHDLVDGSLSGLSATRDERQGTFPASDAGDRLVVADQGRRGAKKRGRPLREEEDPAWAEPSTPEGRTVTPEKRSRRRRSGSWIISLFVYCVLVGIVVFGVWWVYATGMIGAAMKGSADFDFIPKELQSEDFDPATEKSELDPLRGFSGEWQDIFKPGEGDRIKPASSVKLGEVTDSDGKAITIASNAPDQDGEVRIEVPASILQNLAGKTSTLAVTLRADGDAPSQIYIQCEFTTLGDCGRHRFTVSSERADELIQIKFDGKLGPSEPGYVVINSDLSGEGKAIRLYGIRVLPGS